MKSPVLLFLPLSALVLGSCTERTVVSTQQRYSFSEGWGAQTGDQDKIKDKFASGFEIKDGRAVSTGSASNQFEGKAFEIKNVERKIYGDDSRQSADDNKLFSGIKPFRGKNFDTGEAASESGSAAPYGSQTATEAGSKYATGPWSRSKERFRTTKNTDADKAYAFFGPRESETSSGAPRVNARVTATTNAVNGEETLSVDEVRKILHPDKYE